MLLLFLSLPLQALRDLFFLLNLLSSHRSLHQPRIVYFLVSPLFIVSYHGTIKRIIPECSGFKRTTKKGPKHLALSMHVRHISCVSRKHISLMIPLINICPLFTRKFLQPLQIPNKEELL